MAPKRRVKEEEDLEEASESFDEDDDVEVPKKGKKASAKKKVKGEPKPKPPKAPKITETTVIQPDSWTAQPPSLLYKDFDSRKDVSNIAAFDFDGTLVDTKSGAEFPKDGGDWRFINSEVVKKLRQYHEEGYRIAIFSNQGAVKSALAGAMSEKVRSRISSAVREAGVPAVVIISTQNDNYRKPGPGMWGFLCDHLSPGAKPDPKASFFVGDASHVGHKVGDSDKEFAKSVGMAYRDVKEEFGEAEAPPKPGAGGLNEELVDIFMQLKERNKDNVFKARANEKVAQKISEFPKKITMDSKLLKEVNALEGVGKGSMEVIKEFLTTGAVMSLAPLPADKVAGVQVEKTKAQKDAELFM